MLGVILVDLKFEERVSSSGRGPVRKGVLLTMFQIVRQ
jgi:hypothetical protein